MSSANETKGSEISFSPKSLNGNEDLRILTPSRVGSLLREAKGNRKGCAKKGEARQSVEAAAW